MNSGAKLTREGDPIFAFDEHTYIVCSWWCPMPTFEGRNTGDLLACLYRQGDGPLTITLRSRFYCYDKPGRVWNLTPKPNDDGEVPNEDESLAQVDALIESMAFDGLIDGAQLWRREIRGDSSRLLKEYASAPFHMRVTMPDGSEIPKA